MLNIILSDKGLFAELWEYFIDTYFTVETPHLENYSMGTGSLITAQTVVVGLTFGIIIASICSVFNKRHVGDFVRLLISEGCLSADSAKDLGELGYLRNPAIRGMIKSGGTLSRWVRCREEDEFLEKVSQQRAEFEAMHSGEEMPPKFKEPEFKRDVSVMHFYLPEEKRIAAEIKFDAKGASVVMAVIVTIVSLILCAFICYMLPDVLKLVDNFIGIMKK